MRRTVLPLVATATALLVGMTPARAANLVFELKWGTLGSGDGQFEEPSAIAIGPNGNVYVADRGNHRVQVFTPFGAFVTAWGDSGVGDGQFNSPRDITVDFDGNVYVADYFHDRIQVFDESGSFLFKWGTTGTGNGQFKAPRGVHADDSCHVYVSEDGFPNKRVQKFSCDSTYVLEWGSLGSGDGQFASPRDITTDENFRVYVTDTVNDRVQVFDTAGNFIDSFGSSGSGDGQFALPIGVACEAGQLYVSDSNNNRIQVFDASSLGFLFECGTPCDLSTGDGCVDPDGVGPLELGDGQFNSPRGIACDGNGNVYVVDSENHRVQKFRPPQASGVPEHAAVISAPFAAPNPTSSGTIVHFGLGERHGRQASYLVTVRVYNGAGRLVREIDAGRLPSGPHLLEWDGAAQSGNQAPPGVYFLHVTVDGAVQRSAKVVRLR